MSEAKVARPNRHGLGLTYAEHIAALDDYINDLKARVEREYTMVERVKAERDEALTKLAEIEEAATNDLPPEPEIIFDLPNGDVMLATEAHAYISALKAKLAAALANCPEQPTKPNRVYSLRPTFVSQEHRERLAEKGIEIEGFPAKPTEPAAHWPSPQPERIEPHSH